MSEIIQEEVKQQMQQQLSQIVTLHQENSELYNKYQTQKIDIIKKEQLLNDYQEIINKIKQPNMQFVIRQDNISIVTAYDKNRGLHWGFMIMAIQLIIIFLLVVIQQNYKVLM